MVLGSTGEPGMFNSIDVNGNPTDPIVNKLVNFGWEYMMHCHILSHEEMDMMRPQVVAVPPIAPDGLAYTVSGNGNNARLNLTWNDNSINETSFVVQRNAGFGWVDVGTVLSPLTFPDTNSHGTRAFSDTTYRTSVSYSYRVVAKNTTGYGGQYPSVTAESMSSAISVGTAPNGAPTNLSAALQTARRSG